ncbi:MAG: hypothetical protein ACLUIQ_05550 [Dialister invisus]
MCILLITHDLRLAERLSDFLAVMYAERLLNTGRQKTPFQIGTPLYERPVCRGARQGHAADPRYRA